MATGDNKYFVNYRNIVLNIPHSGVKLPAPFCNKNGDTSGDAEREIMEFSRTLVDYFTDELFAPKTENQHILPCIFPFNRSVCDVERLPKDPLVEQDCGIMYKFDDRFYGTDRQNVIRAVNMYNQYQEKLRQALCETCQPDAIRPGNETVLLIDCHSFSSRPTVLCPNPPQDIDICLGFNDDWSKPTDEIIERVNRFFRDKNYRVGINTPFSNSKTVDFPLYYHSLMIEVNKALYMNEDTVEKAPGFARLQADLTELYNILLRKTSRQTE